MDLRVDQPVRIFIHRTCHTCTCTVPLPNDVQQNVKLKRLRLEDLRAVCLGLRIKVKNSNVEAIDESLRPNLKGLQNDIRLFTK